MLESAIVEEIWFFDGDDGHMLGCVGDNPHDWLIEKGVLAQESDLDGLGDLLEGDVVYRIRKESALKRASDKRETLFSWEEIVVK